MSPILDTSNPENPQFLLEWHLNPILDDPASRCWSFELSSSLSRISKWMVNVQRQLTWDLSAEEESP